MSRRRSLVAAFTLCVLPLARASVAVVGPLAHEYTVQIGESYEGLLELQNTTQEPQEVRIYQSDYFFYADGRILYGEPGELPRSNARWITVAPAELKIPGGETALVRYTIQVPDDELLEGSYWSILMVEPTIQPAARAGEGEPARPALAIQQLLRYAVQVVTQIGSSGATELRFAALQLAAQEGRRLLLVDVENPGETWYRATVWAELYDAEGRYVGTFEGGAFRLYPGTSVRYTVELAGVQKGTYKALIVADCGGDDVFGANVNLLLKQ